MPVTVCSRVQLGKPYGNHKEEFRTIQTGVDYHTGTELPPLMIFKMRKAICFTMAAQSY